MQVLCECAFCAVYMTHFWLAIIGKCIAAERFCYVNDEMCKREPSSLHAMRKMGKWKRQMVCECVLWQIYTNKRLNEWTREIQACSRHALHTDTHTHIQIQSIDVAYAIHKSLVIWLRPENLRFSCCCHCCSRCFVLLMLCAMCFLHNALHLVNVQNAKIYSPLVNGQLHFDWME